MKCVKPKPTDLLIVDIFVHVIILLGILLAFFVFIISKLETNELENQIRTQIDKNIPILYDNINKNPPGVFKKFIQQLDNGDKNNPIKKPIRIQTTPVISISNTCIQYPV